MKAAIVNVSKNSFCSLSESVVFVESELIKRGIDISATVSLNYAKDLFLQTLQNLKTNLVFVLCAQNISYNVKKQICEIYHDKLAENNFARNFVLSKNPGKKLEKADFQNISIGEKARCISNKLSSFCGFLYEREGTYFFFLTNNHSELVPMFSDGVSPILENKIKKYCITFKTFGLNEEEILALTAPENNTNELDGIEVKIVEKFPDCEVNLVYSHKTSKVVLDDYVAYVFGKLNEFVYSSGNETLSQIVIDILETKNKTCSLLEGATLGVLTKTIANENTNSKCYITHSTILLNGFNESSDYQQDQSDEMYNTALNILKQNKTDYCLCTFQDIADKNAFYVVVGDKDNIHIFKEVYKNNITSFEDCTAKTALFYFMKKLKYNA